MKHPRRRDRKKGLLLALAAHRPMATFSGTMGRCRSRSTQKVSVMAPQFLWGLRTLATPVQISSNHFKGGTEQEAAWCMVGRATALSLVQGTEVPHAAK